MMDLLTKASYSNEVTRRERDNLAVAYRAACEAMVLLRNDGTLPLKTKAVALYGPGASMTIKGGTGSGEVNERHSVTVLEGLENRGFTVTTRDWISDFGSLYARKKAEHDMEKKKQINLLKPNSIMSMLFDNFRAPVGPEITDDYVNRSGTDACIYVLSRQAGEGGDRKAEPGDLFLTGEEEAAIRFCAERYAHFVLAINAGSSMDLSVLDTIPGIGAVVYLCQLGTEGGNAFADLLSGAITPSGKLSDTWAMQYSDIPFSDEYSYLNGNLKDEYYKEGIYVGYRYFDSFGVEPRYPFGFGLSYTTFDLRREKVTLTGTTVKITASVTNTGGTYAGKETVQVYLTSPAETLHKEYQSLAAFAKTNHLAPGERQLLSLSFDLRDMACYREADGCYVLEPGKYVVRLGNSSRNTVPAAVLNLDEEIIVSRHTHICPAKEPVDALTAPERKPEFLALGLPHITIDPAAFETVTYTYDTPGICPDRDVQAMLKKFTLDEMLDIVVGIGMFGGIIPSKSCESTYISACV